MSFLDAPTLPPEILEMWKEKNLSAFQEKVNQLPKSDFLEDFIAQFNGGPSLAAIKGLGTQHIDALLIMAHDQIKAGGFDKAKETLILIMMLDPYEDRAIYIYASVLQMEGLYSEAGKLYMNYVMLKAMEPRGYLRIGECLLGEGDTKEALEYITGALNLAVETGDELTKQQAKDALAHIEHKHSAVSLQ